MKKLFIVTTCAIMVLGIGGCSSRKALSNDDTKKHLSDKGYKLECAKTGFEFCSLANATEKNALIYSDSTDVAYMTNKTLYNITDDTIIEGDGDKAKLKEEYEKIIKEADVTTAEVSSLLKDEFTSYKNDIASKKAEEENKTYKKGDKVVFESPNGTEMFELTINSVKTSDERNEFSDKKANQVIVINYSYKNLNLDEDLFISSSAFQVIDDGDNVLDTYPAGADVSPKPCPKGTKSDGEEAYGTVTKSKKIKLIVSKYDPVSHDEIKKNFEIAIE